jgi:hypothetical protein
MSTICVGKALSVVGPMVSRVRLPGCIAADASQCSRREVGRSENCRCGAVMVVAVRQPRRSCGHAREEPAKETSRPPALASDRRRHRTVWSGDARHGSGCGTGATTAASLGFRCSAQPDLGNRRKQTQELRSPRRARFRVFESPRAAVISRAGPCAGGALHEIERQPIDKLLALELLIGILNSFRGRVRITPGR